MNPECEFTFVIALRRVYYGAVEIGKLLDIAGQIEDSSGRPGAGGEELRTFRAVGRGWTRIPGHYVRPREREVPPAKQTTFVIVATEEHQSMPAGRSLSTVLPLIQ
jgi:hypothetical protein